MNSEWVKTEIAKARKREVEQKQCFTAAAAAGRDFFRARSPRDHSAREIREYFIPDFSDWKKQGEADPSLRSG